VSKKNIVLSCLVLVLGISGCSEPPGEDLSKKAPQEAADLAKGAKAQTIDEWAKANPNNGAPGSGEGGGK
jgi:hypothetical protein